MRRLGKVGGGLLLGVVVTGMTLWAMGALSYSPLPPLLRPLLAMAFGRWPRPGPFWACRIAAGHSWASGSCGAPW